RNWPACESPGGRKHRQYSDRLLLSQSAKLPSPRPVWKAAGGAGSQARRAARAAKSRERTARKLPGRGRRHGQQGEYPGGESRGPCRTHVDRRRWSQTRRTGSRRGTAEGPKRRHRENQTTTGERRLTRVQV